MLLVIMTRSLIRLDSIVRASLNDDCMTKVKVIMLELEIMIV